MRQVVDVSTHYYLATEYLECRKKSGGCGATLLSWSEEVLGQLTDAVRCRFPVVLAHSSACDRAVLGLLRSRTLGNSPTALRQSVHELHSERFGHRLLAYLADYRRYR